MLDKCGFALKARCFICLIANRLAHKSTARERRERAPKALGTLASRARANGGFSVIDGSGILHEGTTVKQKKRMWKISMEATAFSLVPARQYDKLVVKSHLNEAKQR